MHRISEPPYKDKMGRWRTQSLFFELYLVDAEAKGLEPIYTLKADDWKGLPSFKRIYIECEDPTEYTAAIKLLGYWEHWQKLTEAGWFKPYITEWRAELEIRLRSKAIKALVETAVTEGAKGSNAAKWLADRSWKSAKKGRFSKEELDRERKIEAGIEDSIRSDLDRLGLH